MGAKVLFYSKIITFAKGPHLVLFALFLFPPALFGAAGDGESKLERWSLEKIVSQSIQNAPSLKAVAQDAISAENRGYQAGRWDNPELSLSLGKKEASGVNGKSLQLSVMQSIPIFGQRSINEKIGRQGFLTSQMDKSITELTFQHLVIRQAYRLAAADEQLKHVSHRRDRIRLIEQFLKTRPFASPSQGVEKNLIQNRLREIEERFVEMVATRQREWEALNVFLGTPDPISPDVDWYSNPKHPEQTALLEKVKRDNLELHRQKLVVSTAELEIEQAGKKAFPDVRLGGGYGEETGDVTEKNYFGMLQLSIPLLDAGGYGKDAAQAKREAEESRLEQRRREVTAQFGQAWAELLESKERVGIFPIALVSRLESEMDVAERNWKKGLIPVPNYLELENQVHDQIAKVFDAQRTYVESLSDILLLSGQRFSVGGK